MKQIIIILLLAGMAGAQDNAIGTSALTFSPSEVHLTPRPDTTTIYIYYTGGEVDTIKVLPTKAKSDSFLLKFREAVICSVARQQIK